MNAFVHTPCAPVISEDVSISDYRRFNGQTDTSCIQPSWEYQKLIHESLRVFRFENEDQAKLNFQITTNQTSFSTSVGLTAAELRDLAQRLLDAAHDIETNPAAQAEVKNEGTSA